MTVAQAFHWVSLSFWVVMFLGGLGEPGAADRFITVASFVMAVAALYLITLA